jgi:hypothetical protein
VPPVLRILPSELPRSSRNDASTTTDPAPMSPIPSQNQRPNALPASYFRKR